MARYRVVNYATRQRGGATTAEPLLGTGHLHANRAGNTRSGIGQAWLTSLPYQGWAWGALPKSGTPT
jgi:hypothetical protein